MRVSKKDWLFVAIIVAVFAIFWAISGEEKTKRVPLDAKHQASYDLFNKTQSKMEADKGCPVCHFDGPGGVPFPAKHPVKPQGGPMRCLFCHKLKVDGVKQK